MSDLVVSVRNLTKNYQALRPLRVERLEVRRAAIVAVTGLDAQAAEMLVGLLTGAVLPDEGEVRLLDKSTHDIADSDGWLAMLDAVGIVTDRAVLIGQFSVEQNSCIPFTLEVDPLSEEIRPRVRELADEVGLATADLQRPVGQSSPDIVTRVHLARALALAPALLIAEHPSATLPRASVKSYAQQMARIAQARQMAVLAITADHAFANALGGLTLMHEPATGTLRRQSVWRKMLG
jgi:predicted ABC-type transport system involved in lysophospholipase L1 biosynthesis ATPase subunit